MLDDASMSIPTEAVRLSGVDSAFGIRHSAFGIQHSAFSIQHSAFSIDSTLA
jgi:hypothetical protein